ncbi:ribokinase [Rhodospirillum centenum]|uniref:Ribokinase n=1 Tax=Rhodospirillum centenum (strain ATCC 51521 / SW) TaxID=414684 RepID=B6ITP7_RHOCS|nr:ribokinase [Rhodospirillum centenum]ACI99348.1 ribokinase RbsK [Rhodospirillum centenum SW]
MARIVIAGSMNIDILSTMKRAPRAGETVNGDTVAFMPGGKGLNQAVAAAQLGGEVAFVGRLGRDAFGDQVEAFFREKGIDTGHIVRSTAQPTANAIIFVDGTAENRIVVIPAANGETSPEDVATVAIAPGDVLVSQFEIPRTTIAAFFRRGRAAGARTVLNAAPALDDAPADLWLDTDILVVNETELGHFAGASVAADAPVVQVADAARRLFRRDGQTVVATLGARGAVAVAAGGEVLVPGRPVKAVDTTGAGDCFVGALAARLAAGDALPEAMRYANVAASIAVTRVGTGTAMPTADEVAAALAGA